MSTVARQRSRAWYSLCALLTPRLSAVRIILKRARLLFRWLRWAKLKLDVLQNKTKVVQGFVTFLLML